MTMSGRKYHTPAHREEQGRDEGIISLSAFAAVVNSLPPPPPPPPPPLPLSLRSKKRRSAPAGAGAAAITAGSYCYHDNGRLTKIVGVDDNHTITTTTSQTETSVAGNTTSKHFRQHNHSFVNEIGNNNMIPMVHAREILLGMLKQEQQEKRQKQQQLQQQQLQNTEHELELEEEHEPIPQAQAHAEAHREEQYEYEQEGDTKEQQKQEDEKNHDPFEYAHAEQLDHLSREQLQGQPQQNESKVRSSGKVGCFRYDNVDGDDGGFSNSPFGRMADIPSIIRIAKDTTTNSYHRFFSSQDNLSKTDDYVDGNEEEARRQQQQQQHHPDSVPMKETVMRGLLRSSVVWGNQISECFALTADIYNQECTTTTTTTAATTGPKNQVDGTDDGGMDDVFIVHAIPADHIDADTTISSLGDESSSVTASSLEEDDEYEGDDDDDSSINNKSGINDGITQEQIHQNHRHANKPQPRKHSLNLQHAGGNDVDRRGKTITACANYDDDVNSPPGIVNVARKVDLSDSFAQMLQQRKEVVDDHDLSNSGTPVAVRRDTKIGGGVAAVVDSPMFLRSQQRRPRGSYDDEQQRQRQEERELQRQIQLQQVRTFVSDDERLHRRRPRGRQVGDTSMGTEGGQRGGGREGEGVQDREDEAKSLSNLNDDAVLPSSSWREHRHYHHRRKHHQTDHRQLEHERISWNKNRADTSTAVDMDDKNSEDGAAVTELASALEALAIQDETIRSLKDELCRSKRQLEQTHTELKVSKNKEPASDHQTKTINATSIGGGSSNAKMFHERLQVEDRLRNELIRRGEMTTKILHLQEQTATLSKKLKQSERMMDEFKQKHHASVSGEVLAKAQVARLNATISSLKEEVVDLGKHLAEARSARIKAESDLAKSLNAKDETQREADVLREQVAALKQQVIQTKQKADESATKAEDESNALRSEVLRIKNELERTNYRHAEEAKQKQMIEETLSETQKEATRLRSQIMEYMETAETTKRESDERARISDAEAKQLQDELKLLKLKLLHPSHHRSPLVLMDPNRVNNGKNENDDQASANAAVTGIVPGGVDFPIAMSSSYDDGLLQHNRRHHRRRCHDGGTEYEFMGLDLSEVQYTARRLHIDPLTVAGRKATSTTVHRQQQAAMMMMQQQQQHKNNGGGGGHVPTHPSPPPSPSAPSLGTLNGLELGLMIPDNVMLLRRRLS